MKFSTIALLPAITLASAQRTYNITSALRKGQFEKYRCQDTELWLPLIPKCLRKCTVEANRKDGCAFDDFACHCANYQKYSNIVEPCVFPVEAGGRGGGCTFAELGKARPIVNDMCNFFNATVYAAYIDCPKKLRFSPAKTLAIHAHEAIIVSA